MRDIKWFVFFLTIFLKDPLHGHYHRFDPLSGTLNADSTKRDLNGTSLYYNKELKMEYHVVVEKMCGCARRKDMPQIKTFNDQEDALRVARAWAQQLGKHAFDVVPVDDNFVIAVGEGSF